MKNITATAKGVAINYENTHKSSFIPYQERTECSQQRSNYFEMNEIQKRMYRRLMYGMKAFTKEEIVSMTKTTIFSIEKEHIRATEVVNQLKYERHYGAYNKLLKVIFPQVELSYFKDGKHSEMPTLKELKITTKDIVDAWILNKLLPSNFFNLNTETLSL